jgi:large subunit ribosomal protein L22
MEVKAIARQQRISPMKAREVAREIQGLPVSRALDLLNFTPKKAATMIGRTLKSAVANAEHNHDLDANTLVVKTAVVGEARALARITPRARGSASPIKRRSSHITIILTDEVQAPGRAPRQPAAKNQRPRKPRRPASQDTQDSAGQPE